MLYGRSYYRWRSALLAAQKNGAHIEDRIRQDLIEILSDALSKSEFYRSRVLLTDINDDNVFHSLARFPILSREDLKQNAEHIAIKPLGKLSLVTTSGSTGAPLQVWLDRDRGAREQAFIHHLWSRASFSPGDPRGVFRGIQIDNVDIAPLSWDPALRELHCSPFHLTDEHMLLYASRMARDGIEYLHGYPSALTIFGRYLIRTNNPWRVNVRGIFPISEAMYDEQWRALSSSFPSAKILPFYGMSEKVAFGEPVADAEGYYDMNPLYGWTELVDDAGQSITTVGDYGRLISTGFISRGMPLIRYDTGDIATLVALPSESNNWRLRVTGLSGRRKREFLVSNNGTLISMTAINIHSRNYMSMREFIFRQVVPGRATLLAVLAEGMDKNAAKAYLAEIAAKVGSGIIFELELVSNLPAAARGKRRMIDQHLDLSKYDS